MNRRLVSMFGAALVAGTLGVGCGSNSDLASVDRNLPRGSTTAVPGAPVCLPATPTVPAEGKPSVPGPDPLAKSGKLETFDIKVGDGAEARTGDNISMQYVGVSNSTGKEFDSSWKNNAQPFKFDLGKGSVIKGWDQGIVGMKVGGRRKLVIPPDLGYGATGQGADIGPNETLIFVVDLVQDCSTQVTTGSTPTGSVPEVPVTSAITVPPTTSAPLGSVPAGSVPR